MPERARRRGWLLGLGVLVLVGLVGAAVVMWIASGNRRADNVAGFARAPVGCDTTLDFESTGTFQLYAETSGELGELAGACDAELRYDRDADDIPETELTLRGPDGDVVELADAEGVSYDVDGFVGVSVYDVDIDTGGDHVLTVAPTGGDAYVIAVGRSPDEGVAVLRWGAVAAAIAGLVVGGLLLVLASRRPPVAPARPAPWTPDGRGWPSSPPGFPAPPPTTGATGPAGPPLTSPPNTPAVYPPVPLRPVPVTPVPVTPVPVTPVPDEHGRSPWAPPPSPR